MTVEIDWQEQDLEPELSVAAGVDLNRNRIE